MTGQVASLRFQSITTLSLSKAVLLDSSTLHGVYHATPLKKQLKKVQQKKHAAAYRQSSAASRFITK